MGEALGCGAHLAALRRVKTGDFDEDQCITLEALALMPEEQRLSSLRPVDILVKTTHTPVTLDSENAARFLTGMRRRGAWADASQVAVYQDAQHEFLGTGHIVAGELIPGRLLSPLDISESRVRPPIL